MEASASTLFLILLWYITRAEEQITVITPTNLGSLRGIRRTIEGHHVYEYRRVPYAKPPVGERRFEKPEKMDQWSTTLDVTQYGPSCNQPVLFSQSLLPNTNLSEDCLHLNIYVPYNITNVKKKSIMVFIHGGGFTIGQGMLYDGSYLAVTGDVIVVTINYRLGIFGFFSTGDSVAKGNYGLWDQIMAINWVKDNIESFGGDGESITIFGESAGGMSVGLLCLMPINEGLFKRAIQESGTALTPSFALGTPQSLSVVGNKLNCSYGDSGQLVRCMKEKPVESFLNLGFELFFNPVVDGELLTDLPINLLKNVRSDANLFFRSLDVIIGTQSGEGSEFVTTSQSLEAHYGFNMSQGIPKPVLCEYLATIFSNGYNDPRIGTAACEEYGSAMDPVQLSRDIVNAFSDYYFNSPAVQALRFHALENDSKTYQYLFSRPGPQSMSWENPPSWFRGSAHTDELVFLFRLYPMSQAEKNLSTRLMTYWSNFAKTGDPNGPGLPEWKKYDTLTEPYINFDLVITHGIHLYEERIKFWLVDVPGIHYCNDKTSDGTGFITVQTQLGQMKGVTNKVENSNVHVFRKIPYAQPPVGNLRFEKPKKFGSWKGELDATVFGPSCYQALGEETIWLPNLNVSEDCLHLNIYVPYNISCQNKRSVMVWIHGGGYISGQGTWYNGSYLSLTGNVIVVTINYRLNVFGFYGLGIHGNRGNYGIWDQILAIQWVKDNIAAFGGDSEAITIFGESAGAFSVGLLSIIPRNYGLFKRAILQSGAALSPYTISTTTVTGSHELAQILNCTEGNIGMTIQCLKRTTAHDLYAAYSKITTFSWLDITFAPIVDDDLFVANPIDILRDTSSPSYSFFRSLDILIGTNSADSSTFLEFAWVLQSTYNFNMSEGIPKRVLCDFLAPQLTAKHYKNNSKVAKAICQKYGSKVDIKTLSRDIMDALLDFIFVIPAVNSLRIHGSGNNQEGNRFHYQFSRPSPVPLSHWTDLDWFEGAYHADDLVFEFPFFELSPKDRSVALTLMTYWTNFAKNGNVNGNGLPEWKQYDVDSGNYIDIDLNITTGTHLFKDRVELWLTDIPAILQEGNAGQTSGCLNYKPKFTNIYLVLMAITLLVLNM